VNLIHIICFLRTTNIYSKIICRKYNIRCTIEIFINLEKITLFKGIKISASITFLGSGGDPFVVGKGIRSAGGIVINVNENQFHIDPGPGTLQSAAKMGINLRANTAILLSNTNLYNCNDVNVVIDTMTYSGFDKKGVLIANKTILNGSDKETPFITNQSKDHLERFIVLQAGQRVGINEVEIQALKTLFGDASSIGFKFYTPDFTLTYTSDTKYSAEIAEQYKDSGILIIKLTNPNKENNPGLDLTGAVKIIKKAAPRLAILTGFGNNIMKADPLYISREIQKQTGVQTVAAKDGMQLSPVSYSAGQGQRTFGTFSAEERRVRLMGKEPEPVAQETKEDNESSGHQEELQAQESHIEKEENTQPIASTESNKEETKDEEIETIEPELPNKEPIEEEPEELEEEIDEEASKEEPMEEPKEGIKKHPFEPRELTLEELNHNQDLLNQELEKEKRLKPKEEQSTFDNFTR